MDSYEPYIQTWRERFRQEREALEQAAIQAREQARACTASLVEQFEAERVYLIGERAEIPAAQS